jgi:hypothetical protein
VPAARLADYLSQVHGSVEIGEVVSRRALGLELA